MDYWGICGIYVFVFKKLQTDRKNEFCDGPGTIFAESQGNMDEQRNNIIGTSSIANSRRQTFFSGTADILQPDNNDDSGKLEPTRGLNNYDFFEPDRSDFLVSDGKKMAWKYNSNNCNDNFDILADCNPFFEFFMEPKYAAFFDTDLQLFVDQSHQR